MAYIERINYRECKNGIVELLLEIDPDSFDRFDNVSGLPSRNLTFYKEDSNWGFGSGFSALLLEHGKDLARTQFDLYVSFLKVFLGVQSSGGTSI